MPRGSHNLSVNVFNILPLFRRRVMGRNGFQVRHYGPVSLLRSRRGCYTASEETLSSIGEKWYYFGGTSTLEALRALRALGPSGIQLDPRNTTFSQSSKFQQECIWLSTCARASLLPTRRHSGELPQKKVSCNSR